MQYGKKICKTLKAVRKGIADENGIPLEIEECSYEGDCPGTCPRCEAEVRYLENAIMERLHLGKVATIAGLALGLAVSNASAQDTLKVDNKRANSYYIQTDGTFGIISDNTIEKMEFVPIDTLPKLKPAFRVKFEEMPNTLVGVIGPIESPGSPRYELKGNELIITNPDDPKWRL